MITELSEIRDFQFRTGWNYARRAYQERGNLNAQVIARYRKEIGGIPRVGFETAVKHYEKHGTVPPCSTPPLV